MKSVTLAALLLSLAAASHGAVVYVNVKSTAAKPDGQSWATAFHDVRSGLNLAVSGDEVWVAKGTYGGLDRYTGGYTLKSGIGLYGGFLGTETDRSQRDNAMNVTVLDGGKETGILSINADATNATIVDGFTFQNGDNDTSHYNLNGRGGGIAILGGSPVVSNNVIQNNEARDGTYGGAGGGIYVAGGSPLITNNLIQNNAADGNRTADGAGAGVAVVAGTAVIAGNTIRSNSIGGASVYGGGIYAAGGTIRDNLIAENGAGPGYAGTGNGAGIAMEQNVVVVHNMIVANDQTGPYGEGGGILCYGGTVTDNLFMDNDGNHGGAIVSHGNTLIARNFFTNTMNRNDVQIDAALVKDNLFVTPVGYALAFGLRGSGPANAVVANNTFVQTANHDGYAINSYYRGGETPVISGNLFVGWKNAGHQYDNGGTFPTVTTDHNNVYGNESNTIDLPGASQVGSNGNISADPLFVNASNGDFHLQAASPCINAGNDAYVTAGDTDLDGKPRVLGSHVDIGAYEAASITPATFQQALRTLRIAAGLSVASSADETQLNVETAGASAGKVDLRDAVHLLRAAVGIGS